MKQNFSRIPQIVILKLSLVYISNTDFKFSLESAIK
jgi:hypothetical protein